MREAENFKAWLLQNLDNDLDYVRELAEHGAEHGFPGLTYYKDTEKLYNTFHDEIWQALGEDTEMCGYDNIITLIATFQGAKSAQDEGRFKNLLVWYMAERVARELTGGRYE